MSECQTPLEVLVNAFGGQSELAREARTLTPRQLKALGASTEQIVVVDVLFGLVMRFADANDRRSLAERFADLSSVLIALGDDFLEGLKWYLQSWSEEPATRPLWLRRLGKPGFQHFLRRLVGESRYRRLVSAFRADAAVLLVLGRRIVRSLLPLAIASDRCVSVLTAQQLAAVAGLEKVASSKLFELLVRVDQGLTKLAERGEIALEIDLARPTELIDLPSSLEDLLDELSGQVSEEALRMIAELGSVFANKIYGARDALNHTRDPVSQAANSAIELIDRMLRRAFTADEVVAWVDRWYGDTRPELIHEKDGVRRPTKRAHALCFVHAGGEVSEHSWLHELAATSLVAARAQLEKLKHADQCSEGEKREVAGLLATVEGCLLLTCKVAWLMAAEKDLQRIRERFVLAA